MLNIDGQHFNIDEIFEFSLMKKFLIALSSQKQSSSASMGGSNIADIVKENQRKLDEIETKLMSQQMFTDVPIGHSQPGEGGGSVDSNVIQASLNKIQNNVVSHLNKINQKLKEVESSTLDNVQALKLKDDQINYLTNKLNEVNNLRTQNERQFTELNGKIRDLTQMNTELTNKLNEIEKKIDSNSPTNNENAKKESVGEDIFNQLKEEQSLVNELTKSQIADLSSNVNTMSKKLLDIDNKIFNLHSALQIDEMKENIESINEMMDTKLAVATWEAFKRNFLEFQRKLNDTNEDIKDNASNTNKNSEDIKANQLQIKKVINQIACLQAMINDKKNKERDLELINMNSSRLPLDEIQKDMKANSDSIKLLQDEVQSLIRDVSDMKPVVRKASTSEDLHDLEILLRNSIEEIKLLSIKKFPDKMDTQKSLRLLDAQFKHLLAEFEEKFEKGDNWMLAAKPIGGYKCASCESFLGDPNTYKHQYLPWNKYPDRAIIEKPYRMGNGFSKMLQKMNLELSLSKLDLHMKGDIDVKNLSPIGQEGGGGFEETNLSKMPSKLMDNNRNTKTVLMKIKPKGKIPELRPQSMPKQNNFELQKIELDQTKTVILDKSKKDSEGIAQQSNETINNVIEHKFKKENNMTNDSRLLIKNINNISSDLFEESSINGIPSLKDLGITKLIKKTKKL